jgi:ubiquinone/menaquinone biosynthesis C-methylase UbiE
MEFMKSELKSKWPKDPPSLTEEQARLKFEFLKVWHEILPKKYGLVERFNQECDILLKTGMKRGIKTLEVGAGLGEHLSHEDLSTQEYTALEIRPDFVEVIKRRFPSVKVVAENIEKKTSLPSQYFDRIVAIHILEHLRNLPNALTEIKRLLKPDGVFAVVIPCEGGLAYELARKISAKRVFESLYKVSYAPIIQSEHVNKASEILEELSANFDIEKRTFWPLVVPIKSINLVIALSCRPKNMLTS